MRGALFIPVAAMCLVTAACSSSGQLAQERTSLTIAIERNAMGTPYDGGVRIEGTTQLKKKRATFLESVANRDGSPAHLPLIMREHESLRKTLEIALTSRGLLYAGDFGRATGLLAPRSNAPYGLQVTAAGYFNESLLRDENLGTRILDSMASGRPERITPEMLQRGFYEIRSSYRFVLRNRANEQVVEDRTVTVSTQVRIARHARGFIDETREKTDEQMLIEATHRFFDELPPPPAGEAQ